MRGRSTAHFWGVVLDAPDARELGRFYAGLLGWRIDKEEPDWVAIAPPDGVAYLAVQSAPDYAAPVWPSEGGHQQMMMHLDIEVSDLEASLADALEQGATLAPHQPQDTVRVLFDPVGHPFCLYLGNTADPQA